jgi:cell cycle arrest protein BUB3
MFDQAPEVQAQKFSFKCHREKSKEDGSEIIYPVNALAYHPRYFDPFVE